MSYLTICLAYIKDRPLESLLQVLLLAFGVATIVVVVLVEAQLTDRMTLDARHFDLVVGAKGSALQLVLSTVFQADVPTGNIPLSQAEALRANPEVRNAVPMALGDSYDGFRIVGTEPAYALEYGAKLTRGRFWDAPLEAVLGATVAKKSGLAVGDAFVGVHGVFGGGDPHKDTPYRVVGVLGETGAIIDRLVLTSVESVWRVHDVQYAHARSMILGDYGAKGTSTTASGVESPTNGGNAAANGRREVTALLLRLASANSQSSIERYIDGRPTLRWASPSQEVRRFLSLLGIGSKALRAMSFVLIAMAALSICAVLFTTMRRRRYDLAIMRSLGASSARLLAAILLEVIILATVGAALGLIIGHGTVELIGEIVPQSRPMALTGSRFLSSELLVLLLSFGACLLGALLPAVSAYRIDVTKILARPKA